MELQRGFEGSLARVTEVGIEFVVGRAIDRQSLKVATDTGGVLYLKGNDAQAAIVRAIIDGDLADRLAGQSRI